MTEGVNSPTRSLFEVERSNSGGTFRTGFLPLKRRLSGGRKFLALLNEEAGNNKVIYSPGKKERLKKTLEILVGQMMLWRKVSTAEGSEPNKLI